jgi:hypothetical protein
MTNDKAQMSNKTQNPNEKKEVVLAFKHLDFNCPLDFDIWVYGASGEGATRLILYSYY